jgi:hypothetical protein
MADKTDTIQPAKAAARKTPSWDMTFPGKPFPEEMRRMVWPLCCGFSILSGFKNVNQLTDAELVEDLQIVLSQNGKKTPRLDFQVYASENMDPAITFLTLNDSQMRSTKIMKAIETVGFIKVGEGRPRGSPQGLFLYDRTGTFNTENVVNGRRVQDTVAKTETKVEAA